jgi:hypothetical protein
LYLLGITVAAEFPKNIGDNIAQGIYFVLCWLSFSITSSSPISFKEQHAKSELSETKQLLTILIRMSAWRLIQQFEDKKKRKHHFVFCFL